MARKHTTTFPVSFFNSPRDIEAGNITVPAVGKTFGCSVAAPGTGRNLYRVISEPYRAPYYDGDDNEHWETVVLCEYLGGNVRELTVADVI